MSILKKGGCVAYLDAFGTLVVKDYLEQGKKESATGFTEGGCVGMSWEHQYVFKCVDWGTAL